MMKFRFREGPSMSGSRDNPPAIRRIRQGFTLLELLIVIAVLALLIAILVPSLSRSLLLAKSVSCQGNLHAIGLAAGQYQSEYGDYVPICWANIAPSYPHPWPSWRVCLLPFTSGVSIFNCPAASGTGAMGEVIYTPEQLASQDLDRTVNAGSYGILYQNSLPTFMTPTYAGVMARGHPVWSVAFSTTPGVSWRDPANSIYVADAALTKGPLTYPTQKYKDYGSSAILPPSEPGYLDTTVTRRFADRHVGTNYLLVGGAVASRATKDLDTMAGGSNGCLWGTE